MCMCTYVHAGGGQGLMSGVFLNYTRPNFLRQGTRSLIVPRLSDPARLSELQAPEILLSLSSQDWDFQCALPAELLKWVLGIQTQVFLFAV